MKYLPWVLIVALALVGYQYHARSTGKLEGEIKARGESIKQLAELAATKDVAYQSARKAVRYNASRYSVLRDSVLQSGAIIPGVGTRLIRAADSTIAGCTRGLSACDARDSVRLQQIATQQQQINAYKKLSRKGKIFGFLPRPTVQVGYCAMPGQVGPCISAGFPILK